jgi:acyl dehydratase
VTSYFEDIAVGDTDEFGTYDVTEKEILEFAGQYDPQPFHTDPDAVAETIYGGLIASGWHTCAMTMRLLVDGHFADSAAMGARGVEKLRFPRPVRSGDSLSVRTEVLEKIGRQCGPRNRTGPLGDGDRGRRVGALDDQRSDVRPTVASSGGLAVVGRTQRRSSSVLSSSSSSSCRSSS